MQELTVTNSSSSSNINNSSNNLLAKSIINNNHNDNNTSIKASTTTCNLIGKMINDVSKIMKTTASPPAATATADLQQTPVQQNITTKTTTTRSLEQQQLKCEGGGGKKCLNEDDEFTYNTTATPTTTSAQPTNDCRYSKMTNNYEVVPENSSVCCLSSTKPTTPMPPTSLNDNGRRCDNSTSGWLTQEETDTKPHNREQDKLRGESTTLTLLSPRSSSLATTTTTTLTVKPSTLSSLVLQNQTATTLTHKNITNVPCEASYHRTLETETSAKIQRRHKAHQCELLELTNNNSYNVTSSINQEQSTVTLPSLAERKALLKKEFFKDFPSSSSALGDSSLANKSLLSKRLLKKQHNLKLKIIPQQKQQQNLLKETETQAESISDSTDIQTKPKSLVALRKLDLQRKVVKLTSNKVDTLNSLTTKVFDSSSFPSVKELSKKFDCATPKMIVPQAKLSAETEMVSLKPESLDQRHSPLSDEGCNLGQSPYSSDDDNDSIRTTHTAIERIPSKRKDKVARSASSDSALGLEVDESMDTSEAPTAQQQQKRRMTLTVTDLPLRAALLPLAEPTLLPDSPTLEILPNLNQTQIPSKVLIEERVVEIPEDPRSGGSSRRESSQSCLSDYPASEMQGVRFVRTPSVVVSDYSDDIMCGITLEEIEYFRAQRMRRRRSSLDTAGTEKDALDNNSDVSASSSCSNLYYCGSTISALDGAECLVNGMRMQLERKTSDCSTCSVSGDEDTAPTFTIPEQPEDCQDLSDMLANQHLSCKRTKKVGGITAGLLTVDNTNCP